MALAEGAYRIINVNAKKALEVRNGEDKDGVNVQIWEDVGVDAQLWYVSDPDEDGNWLIANSMSCRVLSSIKDSRNVNNAVQKDPLDAKSSSINTQRWIITDTGSTFTYKGTSYPTYRINWANNTSIGLDVEYFGTANGSNVALYGVGSNPSPNQQWIFVPVGYIKNGGFYKISPVTVDSFVLAIANSSKDSGASCIIEKEDANKDSQVFFVEFDETTNAFYLAASHSGRYLDVWGGAAALPNLPYVKQYDHIKTVNADGGGTATNRLWFAVKVPNSGSYKGQGVVTRGDASYPVYEIRTVAGTNYDMSIYKGGKTSDKNIYVHPRLGTYGNAAQHYIFIPTEGNDINMHAPGALDKTSFTREGNGQIVVSGLSFQCNLYSKYQARYRVKTYTKADRSDNPSWSSWYNTKTGSKARSGWGDAGQSTFDAEPVDGVVSLPFEKSYTLNSTNAFSKDIEFQIRGFRDDYSVEGTDGTYCAHGPSTSTVVKLTQTPRTSAKSISVARSGSNLGITSSIENNPPIAISSIRARLIDSDGVAISEYVSSSSTSLSHPFDVMYRMPNDGETIGLDFSMITVDGNVVSDTASQVIHYSDITFNETVTYANDDSCRVFVEADAHNYDYCYVANNGVESTQLVRCRLQSTQNGRKTFTVLPSLNRDCDVYLIGSDNGTSWGVKKLTCRVDSHLFIWNWTYKSGDAAEDEFTSLIINTDNPPNQTRNYTTDLKFSTPSGRIHPVGFSMQNLTTDLSVSGVVVDDGADYTLSMPLPNHSSMDHIRDLIMLSGRGIHPSYRTPYGDYNTVGIESVNISKDSVGLSKAEVKQRAVKD
ncbi:MAG: RICIN domain-containing protein [Aeriscardovia sp.]|nr:RICIN domain-containing protein [Aeriscardovia sp.]